jgi:predicted CxxxxCH...CXXCH cytochrome family protein
MQVYFDTTSGREWIFDGIGWVPHDRTVDDFQAGPGQSHAGGKPGARPGAALTVPFSPSGAHAKHASQECATCHTVGGSPCFDSAGPAVAAGKPAPAFDAAAKTCSSVACHGAYSGTYTYARWDWGLDDYEWVNVPYSGSGGGAASWYSPAGTTTCASCHANPPVGTGNWHAPSHGGSLAAARKCETCHPDAVSGIVAGATVGVASTRPTRRFTETAP